MFEKAGIEFPLIQVRNSVVWFDRNVISKLDKINASLYKDRLTNVLNNVLNSTELEKPLADRHAKYRRRRKCGQRDRDSAKVKQLKTHH